MPGIAEKAIGIDAGCESPIPACMEMHPRAARLSCLRQGRARRYIRVKDA